MNAQQLRNSILQQAIQGKLVPQDPADEPASVLLQRIRKEKERLVKEGKLKKKDLESKPIEEDEIPFEIPESWEWCKLNDCLDVRDGTHDTPKYVTSGYPLVTSKNLRNGIIDFKGALFISKEDHEAISCRSKVDENDILYAMIGTVGNPVLVRHKDFDFSIKNMALFKHVGDYVFMDYVYWYLYYAQVDMKAYASGGVQTFVSLGYLRNYLIPLPPLAEQRRIVAKIEELMPLVERYGKAQQALDQLNESLPARLRQSILQEAIFGNHVGIQLSEIKNVKLKDICEIVMGQSPEGNTYNNSNGIEFHQGKVAFGEMFLKPSGVFTTNPTKYAESDSIVVSVRAPVGTANITKRKICIGRGLACIKPKQDADLMYIYYLLESPEVREYLEDNSTGTTFKAISGKVLQNLEIPLPPLSEQKRIVAKIEELFGVLG